MTTKHKTRKGKATLDFSQDSKIRKCRKVEQLDEYNSLWVTEWGYHFTVPDFGPEDKDSAAHRLNHGEHT